MTTASDWPYGLYREYRNELELAATRWFRRHEFDVRPKKLYILSDRKQWRNNVILGEVADYIEATKSDRKRDRKGFPLHQCVHHGLSSQAMLFNLVGPLIVRDDLTAMTGAFEDAGIPWPVSHVSAELEIEDRKVFQERQAQPTSIDLVVRGDLGAIYVEAKFVETEFGGCSVLERGDCEGRNPAQRFDDCYLHFRGRQYWNSLQRHGFIVDKMASSPVCMLGMYYQFFREILFALENNGYFVVLLDERNPVFRRVAEPGVRGLIPFLRGFLPKDAMLKLGVVTIQAVVESIDRSGRHEDWLAEFRAKYALESKAAT